MCGKGAVRADLAPQSCPNLENIKRPRGVVPNEPAGSHASVCYRADIAEWGDGEKAGREKL